MARFYGEVRGKSSTPASRLGTPQSGISAHIRGWDIGVEVTGDVVHDKDCFTVAVTGGSNDPRVVYELGSFTIRNGKVVKV